MAPAAIRAFSLVPVLLLKGIAAPAERLTAWARHLGPYELAKPAPDFHSRERDYSLFRTNKVCRTLTLAMVCPRNSQARAGHSSVTLLARLLGLWLRPALRALTWLRQVSLRRKPRTLVRLRAF